MDSFLKTVLLLADPLVALDAHLLGMAGSVRVLAASRLDGPALLVVALLAKAFGVVKIGGMLALGGVLTRLHFPGFSRGHRLSHPHNRSLRLQVRSEIKAEGGEVLLRGNAGHLGANAGCGDVNKGQQRDGVFNTGQDVLHIYYY